MLQYVLEKYRRHVPGYWQSNKNSYTYAKLPVYTLTSAIASFNSSETGDCYLTALICSWTITTIINENTYSRNLKRTLAKYKQIQETILESLVETFSIFCMHSAYYLLILTVHLFYIKPYGTGSIFNYTVLCVTQSKFAIFFPAFSIICLSTKFVLLLRELFHSYTVCCFVFDHYIASTVHKYIVFPHIFVTKNVFLL